MSDLSTNAIFNCINWEAHMDAKPNEELCGTANLQLLALLDDRNKWRNIAGNLYDEMRLRGADCLYRHEDATKDCVKDFELADTI
jgi:hypothetical protein